MSRTLMILAGGTGGHVFPGIAVGRLLAQRGWRVCWLGSRQGMEAALVPQHGFEIDLLDFAGMRGKGPAHLLFGGVRLLLALWQSARAIFRRRPDVVLGFGGYVSFPGGMMASLLNRPLAIHESNAVAGLANRMLAPLADRILAAFPGAFGARYAPRVTLTGSPVREEICAVRPPEERFAGRDGPLRLLVVGGSLGARALNEAVPRALAALPARERPRVDHQAGARHAEGVAVRYAAEGVEARVVPFVDDMAGAYAHCDVVLCRSGAMTVAELCAAGVAAILVPLPTSIAGEQAANARELERAGAALLLPQAELDARLGALIAGLDRERLLAMARAARALGRPAATEAVARACTELAA